MIEQSPRPVSFRLGLYEAIRRTAEAQREAVESDDLDRFYELLVERERLLDKTEALPQELDPADRARAASVVREIMRVDQETERLLMSKIEATREELNDVARGRQALAGYGYVKQPGRAAEQHG
ncbi:MAG TPA: flagellar protein FliT [Chloroflexota bacterium]|nr:flagellar protein FliT [Chloroflexota bacterium]